MFYNIIIEDIPNYRTKVNRFIEEATMRCMSDPGVKIVIATKWMAGMHMFWDVASKVRNVDPDATLWHDRRSATFVNGSYLLVVDHKSDWKGYEREIDVVYVVCDMWDIDPINRMNMGKALIPSHSEIHRIRYPSIDAPKLALRGVPRYVIYIDDEGYFKMESEK